VGTTSAAIRVAKFSFCVTMRRDVLIADSGVCEARPLSWNSSCGHSIGVSDSPPPFAIFVDSGFWSRRPVPRHQFVDALLWSAVHEACQQISKINLRIDAVELAGLDQRRQV